MGAVLGGDFVWCKIPTARALVSRCDTKPGTSYAGYRRLGVTGYIDSGGVGCENATTLFLSLLFMYSSLLLVAIPDILLHLVIQASL